jgi:hypothetical protein
MQHGDFDKTKVLKTQRDSVSDVRKPNSKSVLKSIIPIRSVLNNGQTGLTYPRAKSSPPDLSDPFTGFQSHLPDMSGIRLD